MGIYAIVLKAVPESIPGYHAADYRDQYYLGKYKNPVSAVLAPSKILSPKEQGWPSYVFSPDFQKAWTCGRLSDAANVLLHLGSVLGYGDWHRVEVREVTLQEARVLGKRIM